ncbi:DUF2971 domain-containing protein [Citrobacter tructae]|uniref:DUF2971 domain-containing protein n=2 Tax=Citrobacter tructae TaxID=2562449 RepID=A0ABX5T4Z4_9ENTR|nr:DUF2971 domain-containing protein [Citrobacter tructae]
MKNFQLSPTLQPETKLWRYMSLDKFIDILASEELYFTPLSHYSRSDPYEGLLPRIILDAFSHVIRDNFEELASKIQPFLDVLEDDKSGITISDEDNANIQNLKNMMSEHFTKIEEGYFTVMNSVTVNCWHQNDFESEGMWRLYSDDNKGIAIQTSVQSLIDAISCDEHIAINEVKYIDYLDDNLTISDCITNGRTVPYLKRISFAHEKEVRLSITPKITPENIEKHTPKGIRVKVSPSKLIEKIYISPYVSQPYPSAVSALVNQYKIEEHKLINSNLLTVDSKLLKIF